MRVETIGNCTLYHADCLEVLKTIDAGTIGAVVTDPPYGIGLRNNDKDGHRSPRSFSIHGDESQEVGREVLAWADLAGLPVIVFASPWKPWPGEWRNLIAWDKGGAVGGGGDINTCLKRSWELIQVARNGVMNGNRDESVWRHTMTTADTADHICAKPVSLIVRLIRRFTGESVTILDPFMGSGTVGIAAIKEGRKYIGIEIDEHYFDVACQRIRRAWHDEEATFWPAHKGESEVAENVPKNP